MAAFTIGGDFTWTGAHTFNGGVNITNPVGINLSVSAVSANIALSAQAIGIEGNGAVDITTNNIMQCVATNEIQLITALFNIDCSTFLITNLPTAPTIGAYVAPTNSPDRTIYAQMLFNTTTKQVEIFPLS